MAKNPQAPEREAGKQPVDPGVADNPMALLVSGILLLGGIGALIGWGLSHAYSTP